MKELKYTNIEEANLKIEELEQIISRSGIEKYQTFFETDEEAIIVLDPNTGFFSDINANASQILGYSKEEIVNLSVLEISPKYQSNGALSESLAQYYIYQALTKGYIQFDWIHLTKAKEEIFCEIQISNVIAPSGASYARAVIVKKDKFAKLQKQLEEKEKLLAKVAKTLPGIIYIHSMKTNELSYLNDTLEKIIGKEIGKEVSFEFLVNHVIHPEDISLIERHAEKMFVEKNTNVYELDIRIFNSRREIIWLRIWEANFTFDSNGEPTEVLGVAQDITKLLENEARFQTVAEQTGLIIYDYDIPTGKIAWDGAIKTVLGYEKEEFNLFNIDDWANSVHPEDRTETLKNLEQSIQTRDPYRAFYRLRKKDGTYTYIEERGAFISKELDSRVRLLGVLEDVSLKLEFQNTIKKSEERFRNFYNFASEAIIIVENDQILDANLAFHKLFGYQTIQGLKFSSIIRDPLYTNLEAKEESFSIDGIGSENQLIPLQINKKLLNQNKFLLSLIDLTTIKEANSLRAALAEIQDRNELILNQKTQLEETLNTLKTTQSQLILSEKLASLGQLIAGIAHEINNPLGAIKASSELILDNLKNQILIKKKILDILHSKSDEFQTNYYNWILESFKEKNQIYGIEARKTKKALELHFENLGSSYAREISEELVDLGIHESFSKFKSYINDSNFIDLFRFGSEYIRAAQHLNSILDSIQRVSKIIYALKNFAHFDNSGNKIKFDIIANIETVLTLNGNHLKKGIHVVRNYPEKLEPLLCYPDDLIQVWTNIIFNSIQAMEYRGILTITVREYFDETAKTNILSVCIQDTGHGIEDEIKHKIFEPFFTTKELGEGSGLGLDIVRKVILKHDGTYFIDSKPGNTKFTILLPIQR